MKNLKKILIIMTALSLSLFAMFAVSCKDKTPKLIENPSVTLDCEKLKMEIGASATLSATLVNFGEEQEKPQIEWHTFNDSVAIVDGGVVTAIGEGKTSVIAQAGEYSASCEIIVSEAVVERNDLNITLSQKSAVLNVNSSVKTVSLSAVVTVNDVVVNADVSWSSSDEEYVTVDNGLVTAKKNGKEVLVTAKATYNGSSVTAICKVSTESFAIIVPSETEIEMYTGDEPKAIDFDLYVEGELNEQEKEKVTYSVSSVGVIKISADGKITAINSGNAIVTLRYENKIAEIGVSVGKINYVETAEQFMQIDGAEKLNRFVLTDNIDLSAIFAKNPAIDAEYLIEKFDGELIGNGYTVSGYQRFSTLSDGGYVGLFKEIGANAVIDGVRFDAETFNRYDASLIAANNYGLIKNSMFVINSVTPFNKVGNCLFEISNGRVENTVFIVNYKGDASQSVINVINSGYGTFDNVSLVSAGNLVEETDNCTLYASENELISSNTLDTETFGADGKVTLKNDGNGKTLSYPSISFDGEYGTTEVGVDLAIGLPTVSDGATASYKIIDGSGKDITNNVCSGTAFKPNATGTYYVVHYAEKDGVYSGLIKEVKAVRTLPAINATTLVLRPNETFTLAVTGKSASDFTYFSSNVEVATVNGGVITAVKEGSATIKLVDNVTANKYNVVVSVATDYKTVSNKEDFIALNDAKADELYVLTSDITLTADDMITEEVTNSNGKTVKYRYVINEFLGTLDGQGYKITLILNDYTDVLCGVFKTIKRDATVKNINYYTEVTYKPSDGASYQSVFVRTLQGNLANSYIKADLYPTTKPGDSIGLIGYFQCETGFPQTATVNNCMFELQTVYNDEIYDVGYAVRVGFTPFGYAYNSVFIKNGLTATFFGDHGYHGSAVECTNTNFYKSVYDFVNANNGYNYTTKRVANKLSDGEQVYIGWPSEWKISAEGIFLCGKKVTDVNRVDYAEAKTITISESKGVLSWISDETEFEVLINDKLAVKTQEKTFNVYDYIVNTYGTKTADYNVWIKASGRSGVAVFSIIELDNDNFLSKMKEIDTAEEREFKYFVLKENVTIMVAEAEKFLFDAGYANVDGRGYTLTFNIKDTDGNFRGIMDLCYGLWTNTVIKINAEYLYLDNSSRAFFVVDFPEGGIENCMFVVNARALDENGNETTDNYACVINRPHATATYKNNIFMFNGSKDTVICVWGKQGSYGPNLYNSAIIRDTDSCEFVISFEADKGIHNSAHYRSLEEFLLGNGTSYNKAVNSDTPTVKVVKLQPVYTSWGSSWEVKDDTVKLMGRVVLRLSEKGDDFISDSDFN